MQQRVSSVEVFPNRSELQRMGSQELWDLAKSNCQNEALLMIIRDILYPRKTGLAASAVRSVDAQLVLLRSSRPCEPPKPRWKLTALIAAGAVAIFGGIAHGAGVSIWHALIKPLFPGS
ncbi:hypothetical protein [Hyphomicrobium sp. CS1BSMeth3]|uniref:hypothetical protein n=1 Tax=Hyphomicrobium sp. CS1BSMeth3 TaxID=1892844 RepID=UPI0011607B70|nr:hypothetical protein [Hyphomicrobium sp. CS1BSMeth3]